MIREWSAFVALVLLGWLLRKLVGSTYLRLKKRIDRAVPDHLPMGGGDWLRTQIPDGVRIVVGSHGDEHADAFVPAANVIILSREVYTKHDASFWAVAAHELGHALVYRSSRLVHALLLIGRINVSALTVLGSTLIFANVLYARPEVNSLAFTLLEVSLASFVVVLIDEALASVIAVRILAKDPRVNRRDMVGAITGLLAAFMTYLGGFTGQVVLVLQRDFIVGQIMHHREFVPAEPMGATRMTFVIVLSTILVGWSFLNLRRALRAPHFKTSLDTAKAMFVTLGHELGRGAIGAILVWLVWNQPYGSAMPLVCVAGLVASRGSIRLVAWIVEMIIRLIAILPALLIGFVGMFLWIFFLGGRLKDDPAPLPTPPDSERTKSALEALEVERWNRRSLYTKLLGALDPALHLAFVIGLFVQILRSR
jgi:Zn-dependent membrane protease YugP